MEPKHERCVECGCPVDLHDPDPDSFQLQQMFARPLGLIAEVSLKRVHLPSWGTLSAFSSGLLFLPDLRQLPSGGMQAVEPAAGTPTDSSRTGFWTMLIRRTSEPAASRDVVRPEITSQSASERFLDSPGALFIRREAIVHVLKRGNLLRIERKPGRTVVFRINSSPDAVRAGIQQWKSAAEWQSVVMTLGG